MGEEKTFWVCGEKASAQRQWKPILCCAHQLSSGASSPWQGHIQGTSTWGTAEGMSWSIKRQHQRGSQTPHQSCSWCKMMQQIQSHARDSVKPAPSGVAPRLSHLPKHTLIHGILYFSMGDPHHQEDWLRGAMRHHWDPQRGSMFLNLPLSLSLSPKYTFLFLFISFSSFFFAFYP